MIFDPNMTKKKKKKKKPFMLDEEGGDGTPGEEAKEVEVKEVEPEGGDDREVDFEEDEGRKKGKVSTGGWHFEIEHYLFIRCKKAAKRSGVCEMNAALPLLLATGHNTIYPYSIVYIF